MILYPKSPDLSLAKTVTVLTNLSLHSYFSLLPFFQPGMNVLYLIRDEPL